MYRTVVYERSKVLKIHPCVHQLQVLMSSVSSSCTKRFSPFPRPPGMRLHLKSTLVTTLSPEGGTAEPKWAKPRVHLPLQATGQEAWTGFSFQPTPAFAPPGMLSSTGCRLLSISAFPRTPRQILHRSTEKKQSQWVTTYKMQTFNMEKIKPSIYSKLKEKKSLNVLVIPAWLLPVT